MTRDNRHAFSAAGKMQAAEFDPEKEEKEEDEEEKIPSEMTADERKEVYEAVKDGDIDRLEDLLEKPNADIKMIYFNENLLMTALRAEQLQMAEFLLDNGVDHNFTTTFVESVASRQSSGKHAPNNVLRVYEYSCRQMAYDRGHIEIVHMIDALNGCLFPGITLRNRHPRYRRPLPSPDSTSAPEGHASASSVEESGIKTEANCRIRSTLAARSFEALAGQGQTSLRSQRQRKDDTDPQADRSKREENKDASRPAEKSTATGMLGESTDVGKRRTAVMDNDEGYETMSPSPTGHSPMAHRQPPQQGSPSSYQVPFIPVKMTKAVLAHRHSVETNRQHRIPAKYNEAHPLRWEKVKITGSYATESPLWHNTSALSSHLKLSPTKLVGSATTRISSSSQNEVHSKFKVSHCNDFSSEINTGKITQPKILKPSQKVSSLKSPIVTISSSSVSSSPSTCHYPLKLKVPCYLQMTTSCLVKRQLEPNFTSSYTSLDFMEPSPKGCHDGFLRGTGKSLSKGSRSNSESNSGTVSVIAPDTVHSAIIGSFTDSRTSFSTLTSTIMPRGKIYSKGSSGNTVDVSRRQRQSVPNIRNNSSVFQ